jgi:hypothetical protein
VCGSCWGSVLESSVGGVEGVEGVEGKEASARSVLWRGSWLDVILEFSCDMKQAVWGPGGL